MAAEWKNPLDSCFRRNEVRLAIHVITAQAGIQRSAKVELELGTLNLELGTLNLEL
jgi:hypothetical protein